MSYSPCDVEEKKIDLTKEDLKNIFVKYMNYKLKLEYACSGFNSGGIELTVIYQKNGKEYKSGINPNNGLDYSDSDFELLLNDNVDIKGETTELDSYYVMVDS